MFGTKALGSERKNNGLKEKKWVQKERIRVGKKKQGLERKNTVRKEK